jgi:hypothetical protein
MICSSVCLLRFIVWSFLKARLQFTLDQFNGATSGGNRITIASPCSAKPSAAIAIGDQALQDGEAPF